jgi:hypothetical protein
MGSVRATVTACDCECVDVIYSSRALLVLVALSSMPLIYSHYMVAVTPHFDHKEFYWLIMTPSHASLASYSHLRNTGRGLSHKRSLLSLSSLIPWSFLVSCAGCIVSFLSLLLVCHCHLRLSLSWVWHLWLICLSGSQAVNVIRHIVVLVYLGKKMCSLCLLFHAYKQMAMQASGIVYFIVHGHIVWLVSVHHLVI